MSTDDPCFDLYNSTFNGTGGGVNGTDGGVNATGRYNFTVDGVSCDDKPYIFYNLFREFCWF